MTIALLMLILSPVSHAQTTFAGVLKIDRTVQDWGDVTVKDGPLSCSFELENVSGKELRISSVVSSCGCTGVKWTRDPLKPGQKGSITATYSNDEGPSSFDKTLSVYVEGIRKPLILHLRGVVHKKKLPLSETFPVHFGDMALRKAEYKVGNLSQGEEKSTQLSLANIGKKEIRVSFTGISDFLEISPSELIIPPQDKAEIVVTVRADRSLWGKNIYTATPVIDGVKAEDGALRFTAVTKENFDSLSEAQKANAPKADYQGSVTPEPVRPSENMEAVFTLYNRGGRELKIHRIDYDSSQLEQLHPDSDSALVPAGSSLKLHFKVLTASMKADSENLCVVSLYTNDPQHSIINLYIDAIIL